MLFELLDRLATTEVTLAGGDALFRRRDRATHVFAVRRGMV